MSNSCSLFASCSNLKMGMRSQELFFSCFSFTTIHNDMEFCKNRVLVGIISSIRTLIGVHV